jgi:hypothetical protein
MYHTKDSQLVDSQQGKLYDIWDTLSHKPLGVVLRAWAEDDNDVLVALVVADMQGVLVGGGLPLVVAVGSKLLLECC